MDFKKLLEPYSEKGRTVELQRIWLKKKGIPPNIIDHVMVEVFRELENGRVFENGTALDHELLRLAKLYQSEEETEAVKRLEAKAASLESKFKPSGNKWDKIKMVLRGEL